jgi:hypothetical protein
VGDPEVEQELLVRGGLFERVQVGAVDVLDEGVAEQVLLGGLADHGRDRREAGCLGGPEAALAHDELVAVPDGPGHDRLEDADGADAVRQLGQLVLVERGPWLLRVGIDQLQRQLVVAELHVVAEPVSPRRERGQDRVVVLSPPAVVILGPWARGNQRLESAAQPAPPWCHVVLHSFVPREQTRASRHLLGEIAVGDATA